MMKGIEVTLKPAEELLMQGLTGKTGLTQKEAIFQIIKGVLGNLYKEGVDVRPLILKCNDYGRKEHSSEYLDEIENKIRDGILDGTIPSERYGKEDLQDTCRILRISKYARRIALYWLRKDRRLNGGNSSKVKSVRDKFEWYRRRRSNDPGIDRIAGLAGSSGESDRHLYIYASQLLKFKMFLECMGIDPEEIPEDIRRDLQLFSESFSDIKKAAA